MSRQWGAAGDVPVKGDYDGDGDFDCAVWRPSTSSWYVSGNSDSPMRVINWGASGDVPVSGLDAR